MIASAQAFGLTRVEARGFRCARDLAFSPGGLCALVGEANAGKSTVLEAMWALLDPGAPLLRPEDAARGGAGRISLRGALAGGGELSLELVPPGPPRASRRPAPPVLFLPAALRSGSVVAPGEARGDAARRALELFESALGEQLRRSWSPSSPSATVPARSLLGALEACCDFGVEGVILLIEEPELYLRPQAQRYLYRVLRAFSLAGNQVVYSTHAPAFLNVARLDELALVERDPEQGTQVLQPRPIVPADDDFRLLTEFDAERSELFLARVALLVEGGTEKLVFPFVFAALGHDADREAISIVECGGKPNIPLFARICKAAGVPFVVVHDRDAPAGREPIPAEQALNALIAEVAGPERTIVLEPDFEGIAGLAGHSHKPKRAWQRFASLLRPEIPEPLARAAELAVALARD